MLFDWLLILNISECFKWSIDFGKRDVKKLLICLSICLSVYLQSNSIFPSKALLAHVTPAQGL